MSKTKTWVQSHKAFDRLAALHTENLKSLNWLTDVAGTARKADARRRLAEQRLEEDPSDATLNEFVAALNELRRLDSAIGEASRICRPVLARRCIDRSIAPLRDALVELASQAEAAHEQQLAEDRERTEALGLEAGPPSVIAGAYDLCARRARSRLSRLDNLGSEPVEAALQVVLTASKDVIELAGLVAE